MREKLSGRDRGTLARLRESDSLHSFLPLSVSRYVDCYFSKSLQLELCTALWTRFPSTFISRPFLPGARSAHRLARFISASHVRDLIINDGDYFLPSSLTTIVRTLFYVYFWTRAGERKTEYGC